VCAYCGGPAQTVDHVLPKSRGGASSWLNLVAACFGCNRAKDDRTPAEAGMKLRVTPYVPRFV
jgi:5-methylcytosine-specific restriction endonuclease McrA